MVKHTQDQRPLYEVAKEIKANWKNVYFGADPYLDAMKSINSIKDNYYETTARDVVVRFLANAQYWRGDVARRVKKELNLLVK